MAPKNQTESCFQRTIEESRKRKRSPLSVAKDKAQKRNPASGLQLIDLFDVKHNVKNAPILCKLPSEGAIVSKLYRKKLGKPKFLPVVNIERYLRKPVKTSKPSTTQSRKEEYALFKKSDESRPKSEAKKCITKTEKKRDILVEKAYLFDETIPWPKSTPQNKIAPNLPVASDLHVAQNKKNMLKEKTYLVKKSKPSTVQSSKEEDVLFEKPYPFNESRPKSEAKKCITKTEKKKDILVEKPAKKCITKTEKKKDILVEKAYLFDETIPWPHSISDKRSKVNKTK